MLVLWLNVTKETIIQKDLKNKSSRGFGSHGIHRLLTKAQMDELLDQVAACTTRGHRIHLKVAAGYVAREGECLCYRAPI